MKKIYLFMAALLCGVTMNAKTVYCRMAQDWWKADGAAVAAHMWGGSSATTWPGIRMTPVSGEADLWSIDAGDNPNIIFVRVNGSGDIADWGAKTKDLTIPSDKNLFTITTSSPVWGNPGCDGDWSVYDGSDPGPGPTPQPGGDKDFFLKGYLGPNQGDITTPTAEELFECGVLANYAFEGDANGLGYFFILVCDAGQVVGKCYMAKDWDATATHCTLYDQESTGYHQVLPAPAPSATFYLYDNGDGTYELSVSPLAGKTLVGGCGSEGVEQISAPKKAYKRVVNGQLLIYRGDKVFDATGRQL